MTTIKPKKLSFMSQLLQKEEVHLPKVGELIKGPVIAREHSSVFVDLGSMGTGIIFGRGFYEASQMLKKLAIGDILTCKIVSIDEEEGYIELSVKEAGEEMLWERLQKIKETQEPITVTVSGANKGGLLLNMEGIVGFLPASQLSASHYPRVEGGDKDQILRELQKLVGKPMEVRILDLDPRERKLIFSEKSIENEALKMLTSQLKVGDIIEGEISGVVDFGAFIRFQVPSAASSSAATQTNSQKSDAAQTSPQEEHPETSSAESPAENETSSLTPQQQTLEGLIHISELDWKMIENPTEIVRTGDRVQAKIIDISPDGRISLSLKALKEDPWKEIAGTCKKGDVVKGTVAKFNPFGAFVKINPYVQGLVHISEFGTQKRMQEMLEIGKEYEWKILLIDPTEHRMSLTFPEKQEGQTEGNEDQKNESENPSYQNTDINTDQKTEVSSDGTPAA